MGCWFIARCCIPILVFGGYPISDPYDDTLIVPYNLIDTNPSCFWNGYCPMFPPGGELSAFPNSEEKFQQILHNMHRMFANQSLDTTLGYYLYGANTIKRSYFCLDCADCGSFSSTRKPAYWYSGANQLARFKQWDENTCDQSWYNESDHVTCKWGQEINTTFRGSVYTTPADRCSMFSDDCGFTARVMVFNVDDDIDRCWFHAEGICGGNSCLKDAHCDPIFSSMYDYVGKGFVEGMNGVDAIYVRACAEPWYLLPIGTHFDERMRIGPDDLNAENKHFVLMLQYHDANTTHTQTPEACYALYDGEITNMPVYLSKQPYGGNKYHLTPDYYTRDSYSLLFKAHFPPPTSCQPYAFICTTSKELHVRLPEDGAYYFGTEWIDYVWSNYSDYGLNCKENHYYYHETEGWTVNGGPTLTQSDIWYYQDTDKYGSCIGCQYIDVLDCLSQCVYNNDVSTQCQLDCTATGTPTQAPVPTPEPTRAPTQSPTTPTKDPSPAPTSPTTEPTVAPTEQPTRDTASPTISPTHVPTIAETVVTMQITEDVLTPDNGWFNLMEFGWKQYVVLGVIGLCIVCCVGIAYDMKRRKAAKHQTIAPPTVKVGTLQMHGLSAFPGPTQPITQGKESTDDTDGKNRYTSRFIKKNVSPNRRNMSLGLPVPSMKALGHGSHAAVPSLSLPSVADPQLTPPPPPSCTQKLMSPDEEMEELDDNDIENAMDLDI